MPEAISHLLLPALEGSVSAFWALALAQAKPLERARRALPLCAAFGALYAVTPRGGWGLALAGLLLLLFAAAVHKVEQLRLILFIDDSLDTLYGGKGKLPQGEQKRQDNRRGKQGHCLVSR